MRRTRNERGTVSCEVCGNNNEECFEVRLGKESHVFDSFECAMKALTPKCARCGCQISSQGVLEDNVLFCSYFCANSDLVAEYHTRTALNEQAEF